MSSCSAPASVAKRCVKCNLSIVFPSQNPQNPTVAEEDEWGEDDEEEEEAQRPPPSSLANALNARLQKTGGESSDKPAPAFKLPAKPGSAGAKPPPLPPTKPGEARPESSISPRDKEPVSGLAGALKSRFESQRPASSAPEPPSSAKKPVDAGRAKSPEPPSPPKKPGDKPTLPNKGADKPTPPLPPSAGPKPSSPSLPSKPADKPKVEKTDSSPPRMPGGGNVAGLASALRSRFESQGDSSNDSTPSKPQLKPTLSHPKPSGPALPVKPGGDSVDSKLEKPALAGKPFGKPPPPAGQKPAKSFGVSGGGGGNVPNIPAGPPKLPSKPQVSSKPDTDSNNNSGSDSKAPGRRVHSMAAAFTEGGASPAGDAAGSRLTFAAGKKPNLPAPPNAKSSGSSSKTEVQIPGKPKVGSLVSELGNKLHFGGGGPTLPPPASSASSSSSFSDGSAGSSGSAGGPEPSPVAKVGPWAAAQKSPGPSSSAPSSKPSVGGGGARPAFPAPPPPQPKPSGAEYLVISDFSAAGDGEVDLTDGETVEVLDQSQQDWWLVRLPSGQEGWAPSSYLEPCEEWDD